MNRPDNRPALRQRLAYARRAHLQTVDPRPWAAVVNDVDQLDPVRIGIDVFDTLLVRAVMGDHNVARLVGERLIESGCWHASLDDWLAARSQAVEVHPEGPLVSWFEHLSRSLPPGIDRALWVERSLLIEETVERELSEPVPGALSALKQLRSIAPLIFVSDMHLGSDLIGSILESHEMIEVGDRVVVSCEHAASKSAGDLFRLAFSETDLLSGRAVFIGNDLWSDVTMAEAAGLNVVPAFAANSDRYETTFAGQRPSGEAQVIDSVIAGAARLNRLEFSESGLATDGIRAIGGSVLGQMMVSFVLWAEARCRAAGVTQVEFLARDGEVPLAVARALPSDHWDGMALGYLHCGRRAWSLAAVPLVGARKWIDLGTVDDDAFLLHSGTASPFAALLDRCGLTPIDLPATSALSSCDPESPLTAIQLGEWAKLLSDGELDETITRRARGPSKEIVDFIRQQRMPEGRVALVDVGWRGQQSWMMSAIFREATGYEPLHLHFGGDRVIDGIDEMADIQRFALDDSVRPHPIAGPVSCLEMFLSSDAPRLSGYQRDADGRVREQFTGSPVGPTVGTRQLLAQGAVGVAARMPERRVLESWLGTTDFTEVTDSLKEPVRELMRAFWNSPQPGEAELLQSLTFEVDDVGDVSGPVVLPYTLSELRGRSSTPRQWPRGSLVVTSWPLRWAVRPYLDLKKSRPGSWLRDTPLLARLLGAGESGEDGP